MSTLQHIKGSRTKILNTFPTKSFGNDGDIVISRINGKGVFLCSKAGGMWYAANKMQELKKLEKTSIRDLTTNKLTINNMPNSQNSMDRFVVSDRGNLKYRTGEQIVGDLPLPFNNIDYKTAYCSLGQYSDKETCELNGGTWYYSENDSHDSISSTAENQLLTVGQSIGSIDAEPTLLYDGSTLEIKYNSDYDDNWQTSATTDLLKLTYDSDDFGRIGMLSSGMTFKVEEGKSFFFYEGSSTRMKINADTGILTLYNHDNILDYFSIDIDDDAVTAIKTSNFGGTVGHLTLQPDGDLILDPASTKTIINATDKLYFDGGSDTYITEDSGDSLDFVVGGTILVDMSESTTNSVNIRNSELTIPSTKKLYFDGGILGDTFITESGTDVMRITVGGDILLQLTESGDDGNNVAFRDASVGFTRQEATFSATGIIGSGGTDDTDIDFRFSNKYRLEMTGDITTINLIFPGTSGNFLLVCTTNGDHDVSNWKVFESDESAATTTDVLWAGGSVPAFTNNGVDIVSFYWDASEQQAYGVASLAFATP